MALRPCIEPGCPQLTSGTRCERHRKAKRRTEDKRRPSARERGYDAQWQRVRAGYLYLHPYCEDESGCLERATDVDHIDGLGPKGPNGYDHANLRALCHSHHSKRTARDQGGFR